MVPAGASRPGVPFAPWFPSVLARLPRSLQWLRLVRRNWLGRGSARPPIPLRGYVWVPTKGQRLRARALRPALRCARRHGSP